MTEGPGQDLIGKIRIVPDFPKKGIEFFDITTLWNDAEGFKKLNDLFYENYKDKGITKVVGIEARGFLTASVMAYRLGCGVSLVRKPGKLPYETISESYELEYGTNEIHLHNDAVHKGDVVLLMDDLLATGGTMAATVKLVEKLGASIAGIAFIVELDFLKGREKLGGHEILSLIRTS
ncbi:MAG: adenine phosphoribosyltransferase [Nitrospinota bacterium]|nr:adenine phosphoribosyltransferase [Nitrospinota bacterium]